MTDDQTPPPPPPAGTFEGDCQQFVQLMLDRHNIGLMIFGGVELDGTDKSVIATQLDDTDCLRALVELVEIQASKVMGVDVKVQLLTVLDKQLRVVK